MRNNYISLRMRTREGKWRRKGSHSSSVSGSCDFKPGKKRWQGCRQGGGGARGAEAPPRRGGVDGPLGRV